MHVMSGRSANGLLDRALSAVIGYGQELEIRGQKCRELFDVRLTLEDPTKCLCTSRARQKAFTYAMAELNWYLMGDRSIDYISRHASFWKQIADSSGKVNSNYGWIAFRQKVPAPDPNIAGIMNMNAGSQFGWALGSLLNDKYSRQAVINYNQPKHKEPFTKDFPCTMMTQYYIRDDELRSITYMRSQDLIWGFTYDITWFAFLQQLMYACLKPAYPDLKLGSYDHHLGSCHVYQRHYGLAKEVLYEPWMDQELPGVTPCVYADVLNGEYRSEFMQFVRKVAGDVHADARA